MQLLSRRDPSVELPCCGEPSSAHQEGWCPHEIETGHRILRDDEGRTTWLVTAWIDLGEPHILPLKKRRVTAAQARQILTTPGGSP